jgi:thiol-disulfide isomerase/thioredoxin
MMAGMAGMTRAARFVVVGLLGAACVESGPAPRPGAGAQGSARAVVETKPGPPTFVPAAAGEVAPAVAAAVAEASPGSVVVYVGASWCEPCQAFHHAVEAGELDEALAGVRFVEFDSDADGERLEGAGYGGRYIPRFVVPNADGTPTSRAMEGGIKGGGAVAHIMERLGPLLAEG